MQNVLSGKHLHSSRNENQNLLGSFIILVSRMFVTSYIFVGSLRTNKRVIFQHANEEITRFHSRFRFTKAKTRERVYFATWFTRNIIQEKCTSSLCLFR